MTRLTQRDIKMLKMICQMETQLVTERLGIKTTTFYSRIAWLRKKRIENQQFINTLNALEKTCPRLRKLLTSSEIKNNE
jgi:hypothetical protein